MFLDICNKHYEQDDADYTFFTEIVFSLLVHLSNSKAEEHHLVVSIPKLLPFYLEVCTAFAGILFRY